MGRTARIGTVVGIPIEIQASWLIVCALLTWTLAVGYFPSVLDDASGWAYWLAGFVAALLLFVSVLAHELSHAVVARAHGLGIRAITLHVFGGVSQLEDEPRSPREEFVIAAVGPLTSFVIAGLVWGLLALDILPRVPAAIAGYLAFVNIAVGLFNLVPGFPLDGGRILRAALWAWHGTLERATYFASRAGIIVAFGLMALGILQIFSGNFIGGFWLGLIGLFLHSAADTSYAQLTLKAALGRFTVRDIMTTRVVTVPADATLSRVADEFWRHHVKSFPVMADGVVHGIASIDQLHTVPRERWAEARIKDVMHPISIDVVVRPNDGVLDALAKAQRNGVGHLVVLEGGRLAGYVALKDVMHLLALNGVPTGAEPASGSGGSLRRAA
jgi:Zn-dependent protease/predicted transcriptional regulator